MRTYPFRLAAITTLIAVAAATPLFYIALRAAEAPLATWSRLWTGQITPLILKTVLYVVFTMLLSTVVGVSLAWFVERTNMPGRAVLRWLCALPLAMPAYLCAVCYIILLRRGGVLDLFGMALTGLAPGQLPVFDVYSLAGVVIITSLCVYPYVYLPVSATLRTGNYALEEAARMLGHNRVRIILRVTLPMIAPAVAAGALLVGLYALSDFGTMAMLRYSTFTTAIFNQFAGQVDRASAAVLSFVLIALTLPLLFGEAILARRRRRFTTQQVVRPPRPAHLGSWRWIAFAWVVVVLFLALGLPIAVLMGLAINGTLAPTEVDRIWSVGSENVWQHGMNSVLLAAGAATLATLIALAPAYLATRWPNRISSLLVGLSKSPNALPGIITGLALIMLFNRWTPLIYGTQFALLLGFALRMLPQALTTGESALRNVPANIEQVARTLGCTRFMAFARVTIPAALPGIMASWALVFITAMKELPTALLLRPPGFDTLSVRIWSAASESVHTQAAIPALLLLITTLVPLALLFSRNPGRASVPASIGVPHDG